MNSPHGQSKDFRFRSRQRLCGAQEFARVFKKGRRSHDGGFTLVLCPNRLDYPRLGLAISRKAVGDSVQRNRVKRLIREAFRLAQHRLPRVDIIVIAKPGVAEQSNADIRKNIEKHWNKIRSQCAQSSSD